MSKPVLIEKIRRSEEVSKIIRSLPVVDYRLIKRKLNVQWVLNGPIVSIPVSATVLSDDTYIGDCPPQLCAPATCTLAPTQRVCEDAYKW
jgi:hypothetical protein